ncbi:protein-disulfide reductase DsbD domain-containing protein [Tropicibacter sp. Alg240-R139]|uniref:protein-disulfide reductase DsbD domain-containing protein n=1 Tax=Tropicibacter sp. Alg240-R139 TaxID=2305991 RepID=UPI0013DF64FC|nr:protein-disulfide reductase DsbD domain-containing protein [Tropicibacter sp. Alg240-R139]
MLKFVALAACLTVPSLSSAQVGGLDDIVQLEILDGGQTERGTYIGAIKMTLADGWKTYWRAPGDAGIPPQFDWRGSRNVGEVSFTWPSPKVFDQNGLRTIGYENQLILPVEITPKRAGKPVQLKGQMLFGVCSDICVPGQLKFNHDLNATAGRNPAIAAALAAQPYSAREAGVKSATCRLSPTKDGMKIEAKVRLPSTGGSEMMIIEPGDPSLWASESQTRREGNVLTSTAELISDGGNAFAIDRSEIRLTVLGGAHSVDIQGCTPG